MSNCDYSIEVDSREQSRVLIVLLAINAVMFVTEIVAGLLAESTGLIADLLDMLADATVWS
jgi:Co/Zn/Cd efflux system component